MLYATTFQYAGYEIEAGQDKDGNYWINRRTLEDIYEWRYNSASEKLASKSFKAIAGKDYNLTKKSDNSDKNPRRFIVGGL